MAARTSGGATSRARSFQQAHALYVYSPETTFRLAQDVGASLANLDNLRPLDTAVEQLERMHRIDPNNATVSDDRPDSVMNVFRTLRDDSRATALRRARLRAGETFETPELKDYVRTAARCIDPGAALEPLRQLGPRLDEPALVAFAESLMDDALAYGTGPLRAASELIGARMSDPKAPLGEAAALSLLRRAFRDGQPTVAGQIINRSLDRKDLSTDFRIHSLAELASFGIARQDLTVLESASTMFAVLPRRAFSSKNVSADERALAMRAHEAAGNARSARDVAAAALQAEPKNPDRWADYAFYSFVLNDAKEIERGVQGVQAYGGPQAVTRLENRISALQGAYQRRKAAPATPASRP